MNVSNQNIILWKTWICKAEYSHPVVDSIEPAVRRQDGLRILIRTVYKMCVLREEQLRLHLYLYELATNEDTMC